MHRRPQAFGPRAGHGRRHCLLARADGGGPDNDAALVDRDRLDHFTAEGARQLQGSFAATNFSNKRRAYLQCEDCRNQIGAEGLDVDPVEAQQHIIGK